MKQLRKWILLLVLLTFAALGTFAQAQSINTPYAVVIDSALWVYGVSDSPVMVSEGTQGGFTSIDWSDDGTKLAFIRVDENYEQHLMVADASNLEAPVEITTGRLEYGYPATFTADGQILFAQQPTEFPTDQQPYLTEFYTTAPTEGAAAELVASVPYGIGCGGGSSIPADWAYWSDTSFGGNYLTLEWTPAGIIHSINCSGAGTALLNVETGESIELGTNLAHVKVSADRAQVAGISTDYSSSEITGELQIIDLTTQAVTEVPTEHLPDQLAWGTDGMLFYSTRNRDANLLADYTEEQRNVVYQALGMLPPVDPIYADLPHYTTDIHRFDSTTSEDTIVYTGDAYAIGRIAALDNQTLVFSQIPNLNEWVQGLVDSTLNTTSEDYATVVNEMFAPQIFTLNLNDGSTELVDTGWFRITPHIAS